MKYLLFLVLLLVSCMDTVQPLDPDQGEAATTVEILKAAQDTMAVSIVDGTIYLLEEGVVVHQTRGYAGGNRPVKIEVLMFVAFAFLSFLLGIAVGSRLA